MKTNPVKICVPVCVSRASEIVEAMKRAAEVGDLIELRLDYLEQSDMPTLRRWQRDGLYRQVQGVMPSVTNANNASICCGCFPSEYSTDCFQLLGSAAQGLLQAQP